MISPYSWGVPGGVNRHVEGLSNALRKRGHLVWVMAPDGDRSGEIISAGRSVPVPFNRSVARVALDPRAIRTVISIRGSGFDLAHIHEPLVPLPSLLSLALLPVPLVGTFHAAREEGSVVYAVGKGIFRPLLERLEARIAVSPAALGFVSKYFPGSYRVIPNGVDTERFSPGGVNLRERLALRDDDFVFLFVGRNEPRKGLGLAVEAFRRVRERRAEARLLVVGARDVPRERGVMSLGVVDEESLPSAYRTADVLLAPSLGGESFGMVLVEAMACGVPVIASDIPGYRYVLQGGTGGRLTPVGSVVALEETMMEILEEPSLRERLAVEARRRAEEFSWERVALQVEEVYRQVVDT